MHWSGSSYNDSNNPRRPTRILNKDGQYIDFTYDQFGNILTMTDIRGVTTIYSYDYNTGGTGPEATIFPPCGKLKSIKRGNHAQIDIISLAQSAEISNINYPIPGTPSSPPTNSPVTTTSVSFGYDGYGNITRVTMPGNGNPSNLPSYEIQLSYDQYNYVSPSYSQSPAIGQPLVITDNSGPKSLTNPLRIVPLAHFRYDLRGNCTMVIDRKNNEEDYSYNLADQVITVSYRDSDGNIYAHIVNNYLYTGGPLISSTTYDASNNQTGTINYAYGVEGELLSVTGNTEPVTYTYDAYYRPKTITDGNGHTTSYSYASANHLQRVTYPGLQYEQANSFDNSGRVLSWTDGNGDTSTFEYDVDGQLKAVHLPGKDQAYSYDQDGRMISMSDPNEETTFSYDDLGYTLSTTTQYLNPVTQTPCMSA